MPNGVSCLFFAGKNLIYGQKEKNTFKEGIGVIQTVRGADFLATANASQSHVSAATAAASSSTTIAKNPVTVVLGKSAQFLKRILYPLFIASGVYNTVKSDDKVKTGACQASGIGMMFAGEQLAEKGLIKLEKMIKSKPIATKSLPIKIAWYITRGLAFAGASMLGYSAGNKIAEKSVDSIRSIKNNNDKTNNEQNELSGLTKDVFEEIESMS